MRLQRPQARGCKMEKSGSFQKDGFAGGYLNVASRCHQFEKYLKESWELWLLSASRCLGRYPHHHHFLRSVDIRDNQVLKSDFGDGLLIISQISMPFF